MSMHPPHRPTAAPVIPAQRRPMAGHGYAVPVRRQVAMPSIHVPHPAIPMQRQAPMPMLPMQRRPVDVACRPAMMPRAAPVIPVPRRPADTAATADPGRHRRTGTSLSAALDMVGRAGSAVTLSALLVVAAAIGGLTDGQPPADSAPLTITFDSAP